MSIERADQPLQLHPDFSEKTENPINLITVNEQQSTHHSTKAAHDRATQSPSAKDAAKEGNANAPGKSGTDAVPPEQKFHPMKAGAHIFHPLVDGQKRDFELYVPKNAGDKPMPVVYMLHGFTSNRKDMEQSTQMDKMADKYHFAVAYMQALPKHFGSNSITAWNLDHGAVTPRMQHYDDLNYMKSVIRNTEIALNVDKSKEYIVGHSEGGSAAQYIAQMMPGKFAGLGTVNSTRFDSDPYPDQVQSIRTVAMLAGSDPVLSPWGGFNLQNLPISIFAPKLFESHPLEQKNVWAAVNECSGPAVIRDVEGKRFTSFEDCKGSSVTEIMRLGATHGWNETPTNDTSQDLVQNLLRPSRR